MATHKENESYFCIFYSITEKAIVMMREAAPSQSIIFFLLD